MATLIFDPRKQATQEVVMQQLAEFVPGMAIVRGIAYGKTGHRMGVYGTSQSNVGIFAESETDVGLYATGGRLAAQFEGDVEVLKGDIRLTNADCAENFDVIESEAVEAGVVLVLDNDGLLCPCDCAFDKRVVGVVSGAGAYKPAMVLDNRPSERTRLPIALLGKVYCKADATYGAIEIGDLLTTSPTRGSAMKANDPRKAFGAVIGKALQQLAGGRGLIPILVALQ